METLREGDKVYILPEHKIRRIEPSFMDDFAIEGREKLCGTWQIIYCVDEAGDLWFTLDDERYYWFRPSMVRKSRIKRSTKKILTPQIHAEDEEYDPDEVMKAVRDMSRGLDPWEK